jgi:hypothetical protein
MSSNNLPFSIPVQIFEGTTQVGVAQAPWLSGLPSASTAARYTAIVLYDDQAGNAAGLYVWNNGRWSFAAPYSAVMTYLITGGTFAVYLSVTTPITPPAGTTVYRNGVQSTATSLSGTGVWATSALIPTSGYVLPAATANALGGVKQGSGIVIASDGTISAAGTSYVLPVATASVLGGVKQGANVTIAGDGTISVAAPNAGTVTSVAMTIPSILTVTGTPVTGAGTLALGLATQAPAIVFAGPVTGANAVPSFRALAATDIPALAYAPTANPTFTGIPAAPTQATASTSTTQIATTAFVQAAITARVATAAVAGIVKQAAAVANLTDNSAGAVTTTLTTANVAYTPSDLNNNVAALNAQLNNIIAALVAAGIMV